MFLTLVPCERFWSWIFFFLTSVSKEKYTLSDFVPYWLDSKLTLETIIPVYGLVGSWEMKCTTNIKYIASSVGS